VAHNIRMSHDRYAFAVVSKELDVFDIYQAIKKP
jgi:hypothetical protein